MENYFQSFELLYKQDAITEPKTWWTLRLKTPVLMVNGESTISYRQIARTTDVSEWSVYIREPDHTHIVTAFGYWEDLRLEPEISSKKRLKRIGKMSDCSLSDLDLIDDDDCVDWEEQFGKSEVEGLVNWLGDIAPQYLPLHNDYDNSLYENLGKKNYDLRYKRDEESLMKEFQKKYGGTALYDSIMAFREEYEEEYEEPVLSGLFGEFRKPWMLLCNGEAREELKKLPDGAMMYFEDTMTIAKVHETIFKFDINLTGFCCRILESKRPDPYKILTILREQEEELRHSTNFDSYAVCWNAANARDVLRHLVQTYEE